MSHCRFVLTIDIAEDLLQQFIQHVRDFDIQHPGCHFSFNGIVSENITAQDMLDMLRSIDPPFNVTELHRKH